MIYIESNLFHRLLRLPGVMLLELNICSWKTVGITSTVHPELSHGGGENKREIGVKVQMTVAISKPSETLIFCDKKRFERREA